MIKQDAYINGRSLVMCYLSSQAIRLLLQPKISNNLCKIILLTDLVLYER